MTYTLESLRDAALLDILLADDPQVRIYSREHHAWWRKGSGGQGNGYAIQRDEAGVWSLYDALEMSHHCGPEKGIQYEVVESA